MRPQLQKGINGDFWISKIATNIQRDSLVDKKLLYLGWTVIRFWGKDIEKHTNECVGTIEDIIFDNEINRSEYDGYDCGNW